MKTKIEIKNRFTKKIIFEFETENNSVKETVKQFIRQELAKGKILADLRYADLSSADLRYAELSSADLSYADLSYADLSYADLRSAELSSADLSYANLRSADLRYADLSSADLSSAELSSADLRYANLSSAKNKKTANIPLYCTWSFSILGDKIQIGCEARNIEEWDDFFASTQELSTKRGTKEFKQIEAIYLACKSYLTHLKL